jgi:hypothetical protein
MPTITIADDDTLRLHSQVTPDTILTLEPDSLLIANKLSFIAPAAAINLASASGGERAAVLEIKHLEPLAHAEFFSNHLTLDFVNGTSTTLNIVADDSGSMHPFQVAGTGDFYLAPLVGFDLPRHTVSVPTTFFV